MYVDELRRHDREVRHRRRRSLSRRSPPRLPAHRARVRRRFGKRRFDTRRNDFYRQRQLIHTTADQAFRRAKARVLDAVVPCAVFANGRTASVCGGQKIHVADPATVTAAVPAPIQSSRRRVGQCDTSSRTCRSAMSRSRVLAYRASGCFERQRAMISRSGAGTCGLSV